MYIYALVLLFLIRLRFPRGKSIAEIITRRYGQPALTVFRNTENHCFKTKKLECDLNFLSTCKEYNIIPKFIRFKVYNPNFQNTRLYRSWSFKLLDLEIKNQRRKLQKCKQLYESASTNLKSIVSFLDFSCLISMIKSNSDRKISNVKITHHNKLKALGIDLSRRVDVNKVIFNLSDRNLSNEEKDVLSLGLDFALKPNKVNYFDYFLSFERVCNIVRKCNKYGNEDWNSLLNRISGIANTVYHKLCNNRIRDPINEQRISVLKTLKEDNSIIITRPDKGRGVVLMNKVDYDYKMGNIVNDYSKFRLLNVDFSAHVLKMEDKLNRILRSIKDILGEFVYNELRVSGSKPGILYGLPKIHKLGNPLRPIVSSIGTFSYKLAKFLVPLIEPLTKNEYTIENSKKFVNELCNLNVPNSAVMASFDVESLFTNVPLKETTDIITSELEEGNFNTFGLNKLQLSKLLTITTSESIFTFNDKLYAQVDGVSMGSCLGPTYANAFLCYHKQRWLNDCPLTFKPLYYRRYVDDTFLLFRHRTHIHQFLEFLNNKHQNIKFTCETEENGKLSFLDALIINENGKFYSTVYRKPTFTGLGLNYLSFTAYIFKLNSIRTLVNRAYSLCSTYKFFDLEIKFLRNFFTENAYPTHIFDKIVNKFLNDKFSTETKLTTVKKDVRYLKIPFVGHLSFVIRKQLINALKDSFPQINFRVIFTNRFTIASILKQPKAKPFDLTSDVVYLFSCPCCTARYIGSSTRWLKHRICDHMGVSTRTSFPLTNPPFSAIREHSHDLDNRYTYTDFSILNTSSNRSDLLTLEALYIDKMKPSLNRHQAVQLYTK